LNDFKGLAVLDNPLMQCVCHLPFFNNNLKMASFMSVLHTGIYRYFCPITSTRTTHIHRLTVDRPPAGWLVLVVVGPLAGTAFLLKNGCFISISNSESIKKRRKRKGAGKDELRSIKNFGDPPVAG
jgi:hypothetical protein